VLIWRVGTGPIVRGLRETSIGALAIAVAITAVTTLCAAWRWQTVARGLGTRLALGPAFAAYYRSQFLNTTLPGGVLGDVHRGVAHGREVEDVGRALRAVAWERCAGQAVQVLIAVAVLLIAPSPVQAAMPYVVTGLLAAVGLAAFMVGSATPRARAANSRWAQLVETAAADIRNGVLARTAWPRIAAASVVIVAGHTAVFLLAVRSSGSTASTFRLLPLAMLVLLAMVIPTSVGGWGPREGVAAWLFSAAGLGAATGLSAATAYGLMVVLASLPGAAVMVVVVFRQRRRRRPVAAATTDWSLNSSPAAVVHA
jgi:uncharacterized membrane protein YbhN (UPF0104 family)